MMRPWFRSLSPPLYAQEGQPAELKRLAAEVMPAFESCEVHREALAALLMFQQACERVGRAV